MDVSREINGVIIPQFPGLNQPSIDFDDVRSGKRARIWWYDLDLTNARAIGGAGVNAAALIQLAGNSFYIDQYASGGFATAYFQETQLSAKGAPVYIGPGFILKAPVTQILFENTAQAGKTLRIIYGIDIDFTPGQSQTIASIGSIVAAVGVQGPRSINSGSLLADLPVQSRPVGFVYASSFKSSSGLGAGSTEQVFAAASNPNGAMLWDAEAWLGPVGIGSSTIDLHAHTAAPAAFTDGDVLMCAVNNMLTAAGAAGSGGIRGPVFVPSGKGLWFRNNGTVNSFCGKRCLYTLY